MPKFSSEEILSFCKLLETRIGIVVKDDRLPQIKVTLEDFFQILDITNFHTAYNLLANIAISDSKFQVLAEKITIGETFFFRDQMQFQALQNVVLPQIIDYCKTANRPISILSGASSTGEEIYSIAIVLSELLPVIQPGQIRLIGGDINGTALAKARKAVYSKWSFRGVPPWITNKYFSHQDDQYHLSEKIKSMVQFQYLNLAEPFPFVDLDLILLRNVLIYFSNSFIEKLSVRCSSALRDGGWLLVGTSELNRQNFRLFDEQYCKDAVFYRKKIADYNLLDNQKLVLTTNFDLNNQKLALTTSFEPNFQYKAISDSFTSPITTNSSKIANKEEKASKEEKTSKETYKTALEHFEKHEFSQAENLLNKILDKEVQALLLMAKIAANLGNNTDSERFCHLYLSKEPNSLEGHYLIGLIYQADNKFNKAAQELRYTVLLDNSFVMGHWNLALVYQKTDDKQAAKRHLLQVKRLLDNYPSQGIIPFSEGQKAARILQIVDGILGNLR